jgi:hypothetical protein
MPDPAHRDLSDRGRGPDQWQQVRNEHWPPLGVARALRDAPTGQQVDVTARVVFSVDGEQHLPGRATRWTRHHVCVVIDDPRLQVAYVWLRPADVHRTGGSPHQLEG